MPNASQTRRIIGADDTVARVVGDEFAPVAPSLADCSNSKEMCRRMVDAVEALAKEYGSIGLSIGVAASGSAREPFDHVPDRADSTMYEAKRTGGGYRFSPPGQQV